MSSNVIKYAFVAGEVGESLFGRTDLEKYDLGMAWIENWFVDYRGGISTRMGTEFCGLVANDGQDTKFFKFQFSPTVANSYVLLFGDFYVRFMQDGGYVLEGAKTVTAITLASPPVITSAGHGYVNGDWVEFATAPGIPELIGRSFIVQNAAANTFEIGLLPGPTVFSTVGLGPLSANGTVRRVYTLTTPYAAADLVNLKANQIRDTIRLTHMAYATRDLKRIAHTNWTLTATVFDPNVTRPTGLVASASAAGGAGTVFAVTAVDKFGNESLASDKLLVTGIVNYAVTEGSLRLKWTPVTTAAYYNVYRANIAAKLDTFGGADGVLTRAMDLGWIGKAFGTEFRDTNIIPDFVRSPPTHNNPFINAGITRITVTAGGAGYTNLSILTVTDASGTGFSGYPIVVDGAITAVVIENGGHDYIAPVITANVGAGATFTYELVLASGNYPAVASIFQQRQIYAATMNEPLTIFASKPGRFNNFDNSFIVSDSDSWEHELDIDEVTPIRHLVSMRGGMLVFTQTGIWQLSGTQGGPVTPTNALAEPQSYGGCSIVPPLRVDTDLLYIEGRGVPVRLLGYNDIAKIYSGTDVSILSNHLLSTHQIQHWDYANEPFKLVWANREDGTMLNFTILREQNLYAWSRFTTQGLSEDVIVIQEGLADSVYMMVSRYLQGRWTKCVERMTRRDWFYVEGACCLDSSLSSTLPRPNATVTPAATFGTGISIKSQTAIFSAADVGKVFRGGGGKATVTTFINANEVSVDIVRPFTRFIPNQLPQSPLRILAGDWSLTTPFTVFSGLWHLEGQTVGIMADGNVLDDQVVVNGAVTLSEPATSAHIGLKYRCAAQTLPPSVNQTSIESRTKRIVGVAARISNTRGLLSGARLDHLYPMKERTIEIPGQPTNLIDGTRYVPLEPTWDENGQTWFVVEDPVPATILGLIIDLEVGDDPD